MPITIKIVLKKLNDGKFYHSYLQIIGNNNKILLFFDITYGKFIKEL